MDCEYRFSRRDTRRSLQVACGLHLSISGVINASYHIMVYIIFDSVRDVSRRGVRCSPRQSVNRRGCGRASGGFEPKHGHPERRRQGWFAYLRRGKTRGEGRGSTFPLLSPFVPLAFSLRRDDTPAFSGGKMEERVVERRLARRRSTCPRDGPRSASK